MRRPDIVENICYYFVMFLTNIIWFMLEFSLATFSNPKASSATL